jgi:tetraacyldisaccharide-1-P 4'-kinase
LIGSGSPPFDKKAFAITGYCETLRNVKTGESRPLKVFSGEPAVAFCAIASPDRFFKLLLDADITIMDTCTFADHDNLKAMSFDKAMHYITTEKDAVKLKGRADLPDSLWVCEYEMRICDEEAFADWLLQRVSR